MTDTRTLTVHIPTNKKARLTANIIRLNKRARKLRAGAEFSATFGEEFARYYAPGEHGIESISKLEAYGRPGAFCVMFVEATVTGPDFQINGYRLIAKADFRDGVQFTDFAESDFDGYAEIDQRCDHCSTNRDRKQLYVLEEIATGRFRQIGHTCVKDFLGYTVADATRGAGLYLSIREWADEFEADLMISTPTATVAEIIATALAVIEHTGYISRDRSYGSGREPTSETVKAIVFDRETTEVTDAHKAKAAEVIEWARTRYAEPADGFSATVAGILEAGNAARKQTGFVACLPAIKAGEEARAAAAEAAAESDHFGTIGKRIEAEVEVIGETTIDGYYGTTFLYTMRCAGNIAKWFASNPALNVGESYSVRMTVKKHDEYNGTKQTVVNRVAVQ